ncbi:MAG TPA: hypothetical protein VM802_07595 [Chitinophaga sp.]|uniref:hypothetical protein n=1 Tax=Chitinophaga sp. TaxID=1869181 RepID=UPI002CB771EC|nr:hypothetical protein [Chitinophaga sp.]HVI44716.1 hypothetical protein [Chitinophaga sp.]
MKLQGLTKVLCAGAFSLCITGRPAAAQQLKLGVNPTAINKLALLELNSDRQGLLLSRVPLSRIQAGGSMLSAPEGMLVYVKEDKCLYIRKDLTWQKVADFGSITTDNVAEGTTNLYFTTARARAAFSAGTGISITGGSIANTGVLSFAGRTGAITPVATDYASFYTPIGRNITINTGTGIKSVTPSVTQDLSADRTWTITADNTNGIWNASQLLSYQLDFTTAPAANNVLTFNGTTKKWEAKPVSTFDPSRKLSVTPGSGVLSVTPAITQDLSADRNWIINVDSSKNIWNANKIQKNPVIDSMPGDGDVLKWNKTRNLFVPSPDITGGASYGDLADADISNANAPDPKYRMKIWKGYFAKVVNGPETGPGGAWAWSVLAFQNTVPGTPPTEYTTQLYFDKNTLGIREWKGSSTVPLTDGGNPWYKVVTTHGANQFTDGGLIFAGKTNDATTEVRQDASKLFWDNTSKELGIGTNAPNSTVHVEGSISFKPRVLLNAANNTTLNADATMYTIIVKRDDGLTNRAATVNLPATTNNIGRIYIIRRLYTGGSTGTVTVRSASGDVINGNATNIPMSGTGVPQSIMIQCISDGEWATLATL